MEDSMKTSILIGLTFIILGSAIMAQKSEMKTEMVQDHLMYIVLNKGDIPGIYDPQFLKPELVESFYYADEPVMVVRGKNESHAYSTWHLDHHEIVNDRIDGVALAATW